MFGISANIVETSSIKYNS